jgi:uncharacterized protein YlxP (DUF503 family)
MVVGVCQVDLHFPDEHSLKAKRQILSSLKSRLGKSFNVSVAELEGQDLWQRSVLGIACIANEGRQVNRVLDQVLNMIRSNPTLELLDSRIELL